MEKNYCGTLTLNHKNNTIEISKKFASAAAKYGSNEYSILREVRRENPDFKVVEVSRKASKSTKPSFKGLTYEYMEEYILSHDDKDEMMKTYLTLRGETKEAEDANATSQTYMEIKDWFLASYPDIAKFHETRIALIDDAQKKRAKIRADREQERKNARLEKLLSRTSA